MFNEEEIMRKGMECLTKELGDIEAEFFITRINRNKFDYTEWQRDYFDKMTPEEISKAALEDAKKHPFKGKAKRL